MDTWESRRPPTGSVASTIGKGITETSLIEVKRVVSEVQGVTAGRDRFDGEEGGRGAMVRRFGRLNGVCPIQIVNQIFDRFEDLFTRWIEVKPVPSTTGTVVYKALDDLVIFRWRTLRRLVVDNGSEFDNKRKYEKFRRICRISRIL